MNRDKARHLRSSPTDAELRLWRHIRRRHIDGHRFRRQHPLGPYIVDFACLERHLIIELDGGQHSTSAIYDAERTAWLESKGYRVLRFWNNQVFEELEGVLEAIGTALKEAYPPS